jgi:hypothetical protein
LGTGPVTFYGGALRLHLAAIPGNNPSVNTAGRANFTNDIIVPAGQTGTIYMSPRPDALPVNSGAVSGGGTLNMIVDYVRGNVGGDWSGFTGRVFVASSTRQATSDLRLDNVFVPESWSNNAVSFTNNGVTATTVNMQNSGAPAGRTIVIGEMEASIPGIVSVNSSTAR